MCLARPGVSRAAMPNLNCLLLPVCLTVGRCNGGVMWL